MVKDSSTPESSARAAANTPPADEAALKDSSARAGATPSSGPTPAAQNHEATKKDHPLDDF